MTCSTAFSVNSPFAEGVDRLHRVLRIEHDDDLGIGRHIVTLGTGGASMLRTNCFRSRFVAISFNWSSSLFILRQEDANPPSLPVESLAIEVSTFVSSTSSGRRIDGRRS